MNEILLQNGVFRLSVDEHCIARSLTICATGEECLDTREPLPLFTVTQARPFNNEVKLSHPNKRYTFPANRLRREGNLLRVGFEIAPYEALVEVIERSGYIAFKLQGFDVHPGDYEGLDMSTPPVCEFRLLQLPVRDRNNFGEWLNVVWDDSAAVNVLAATPQTMADSERHNGYRILMADACRGLHMIGAQAALIACPSDALLDHIDVLERDYDMPRGVESRRKARINASTYWTAEINPKNVDEHIAYAKACGMRMMLIYYSAICKEEYGYSLCGNYDYRGEYPNGAADLKKMLDRIKSAGITPGLHFLQTHIGLKSRYVTPVPDPRLHLTDRFTLSRPLDESDDCVYVFQCPECAVMAEKCRVLRFGSELISYTGYTVEPPFRFTGCVRGALGTVPSAHPAGETGGVLDISEFGASSCYVDQETDLQDEIADKIAAIYNQGFEFVYMDGSEGTNAPYEYYVPLAQCRVRKKLFPSPVYCAGAAKSHYSWHYMSGGNAFDIFQPPVFKEKILEHPFEEAPRMRQDFTKLNFGWWGFWVPGTQADMYEFGTSKAAAWDCPVTVMSDVRAFRAHPRCGDIMETLRRWEDVRATDWLTEEQKRMLRAPNREFTLLINEQGEYELVPWEQIPVSGKHPEIRAFLFSRRGLRYVAFWHTDSEGQLELLLDPAKYTLRRSIGGTPVAADASRIPVGDKLYLETSLTEDEIRKVFETL